MKGTTREENDERDKHIHIITNFVTKNGTFFFDSIEFLAAFYVIWIINLSKYVRIF